MSSNTDTESGTMPPSVTPLSRYTRYHLNAATPARPEEVQSKAVDAVSTSGVRGSDVSSEVSSLAISPRQIPALDGDARDIVSGLRLGERQNDSPTEVVESSVYSRFTLLEELPTELQDQIWRATMAPRIVELRAREVKHRLYAAQQPVPIWNVSKKKRADVLSAHGYVALQVPARREGTSPCTFVINPKIDMLYISIWTDCSLKHDKLLDSLRASHIIDKIRCVALDYTETRNEDGSLNDWIRNLDLQALTGLELVLIVLQAQNMDWPTDSEMLSRFEVFVEEDNKDDFPWIADDIMVFKQQLQKKWARGPEKTTPHIVFVEEFYKRPIYWDLEEHGLPHALNSNFPE